MIKKFSFYILFLFCCQILKGQLVISLNINSTINPVTAGYIHDGIKIATEKKAECLLIHLNTPGGLLVSTRAIVSDLLVSPVPVIVYVSPGGAHAGSAGVFITLAAHIAAMAPGTNIGAAHPVTLQQQMDSVMSEKVTNDASAFIKTIAEIRKRNMEWPEEAVRKSLSITENEALQKKVIDLVASDDADLLMKIDGKTIELNAGPVTIHTAHASIEVHEMNFIEKVLNFLSDPNVAYILMTLGMLGIMMEFYNPGAILPGIVGVISLILAFYTMHTLPINYAGLALIVFGIILFLLEIKMATHGLLAIGGGVSFLLGSLMLIDASSSLEFVKLSKSVVITSTIITTLLFGFVIGLGLKAQKRKAVTGLEAMVGMVGETINDLDPMGRVKVNGEAWNAESVSGSIAAGLKVKVTSIKNLKLFVELT